MLDRSLRLHAALLLDPCYPAARQRNMACSHSQTHTFESLLMQATCHTLNPLISPFPVAVHSGVFNTKSINSRGRFGWPSRHEDSHTLERSSQSALV